MSRNTLEHRGRHQTEDRTDDRAETLDYDTKTDILTRYIEKMAETHTHVVDDLVLLNQHKGRDQTDWDQKFQQHDLPAQYTHAFNLATKDLQEHERTYAAQETAKTLGYPLESKLQDFHTEILFHKTSNYNKDILDPENHRALLHYTEKLAHRMLEEQQATLADALEQRNSREVKETMLNMSYTSHAVDQAKEGYILPHHYQQSEELRYIADQRQTLLDHRFQDYLAAEHPDLRDKSPSDSNFQGAFRDFSRDYLEGDIQRLAERYASQAAGIRDGQNFSQQQHQERLDVYQQLTRGPEDNRNPTYREMLLGAR